MQTLMVTASTVSPCRKKGEAEKSTEIELNLTIFERFLEVNLSLTSLTIFGR